MDFESENIHLIANHMFYIPAFLLKKNCIRKVFREHMDYVYAYNDSQYEVSPIVNYDKIVKDSNLFIKNFGQVKIYYNMPFILNLPWNSIYKKNEIYKYIGKGYNFKKMYSSYFGAIANYNIKLQNCNTTINIKPIIHILPFGIVNIIYSTFVIANRNKSITHEDINEIVNILNGHSINNFTFSCENNRYSDIKNFTELTEIIKSDVLKSILVDSKDVKYTEPFEDQLVNGVFINILKCNKTIEDVDEIKDDFLNLSRDLASIKVKDYKNSLINNNLLEEDNRLVFINRKRWICFSKEKYFDKWDYYFMTHKPYRNTIKSWSIYRIYEFTCIEYLMLKFLTFYIKTSIIDEIRKAQYKTFYSVKNFFRRTFFDFDFFEFIDEFPKLNENLYGFSHKAYKIFSKQIGTQKLLSNLKDYEQETLKLINSWKPGVSSLFPYIKNLL